VPARPSPAIDDPPPGVEDDLQNRRLPDNHYLTVSSTATVAKGVQYALPEPPMKLLIAAATTR